MRNFYRREGIALATDVVQAPAATWLLENGPRELESLFRAIVFHPSAPILLTDNERNYQDASTGAGKMFGVAREEILGHCIDEFADPESSPTFPSCGRRSSPMENRKARCDYPVRMARCGTWNTQ